MATRRLPLPSVNKTLAPATARRPDVTRPLTETDAAVGLFIVTVPLVNVVCEVKSLTGVPLAVTDLGAGSSPKVIGVVVPAGAPAATLNVTFTRFWLSPAPILPLELPKKST